MNVADALQAALQLLVLNVSGPPADRWIVNAARSFGLAAAAEAQRIDHRRGVRLGPRGPRGALR
eukprot:240753-Pyramimonas_sp.AAC.1